MVAVVPFLALVQSWFSRADLPCSPSAMTLRVEKRQETRKRLESFLYFLLIFLKRPWRSPDVGCTDFAPCKRLLRLVSCFAYKMSLLRVRDLLCLYTTCALKATYAYDVRLLRVSNLMCTLYVSYAWGNLLRMLYAFFAQGNLCFSILERPIVRWLGPCESCDDLKDIVGLCDHALTGTVLIVPWLKGSWRSVWSCDDWDRVMT